MIRVYWAVAEVVNGAIRSRSPWYGYAEAVQIFARWIAAGFPNIQLVHTPIGGRS